MYIDDADFRKPTELASYVWRYMNFTKFVSILSRKELFFPRANKLGDTFEGSFSKRNLAKRREFYAGLFSEHELPDRLKDIVEFHKFLLEYTFISSWHLNDHESAAMWNLYALKAEGIAIRSTFKRLCDSFKPSKKEIRVGEVQYSDYEKDWIPEDNSITPFLHKRKSFEHEKEVRAIFQNDLSKWSTFLAEGAGEYITVDLPMLVDAVYVSPTSSDWFYDLVKAVVDKYEMHFEIHRSSLDESPVY